MKDRIVLKAVKGNCEDCYLFNRATSCLKITCDSGKIYIEDTEQGWISVEDELPKTGMSVLVFNQRFEHESIRMAFRTSRGMYDAYECGCGMKLENVTHWQPLPEPPKAEPIDPVCPECFGSGWKIQFKVPCKPCHGTGYKIESNKWVCPKCRDKGYIEVKTGVVDGVVEEFMYELCSCNARKEGN